MKIKTSELTGAALDWAVAKCRGFDGLDDDLWLIRDGIADMPLHAYTPSTDWAQGGPIIERAGITLSMRYGSLPPNHVQDVWDALIKPEFYSGGRPGSGVQKEVIKSGPTPLTAAMRCYVASQLGEDIDVPEELLCKP